MCVSTERRIHVFVHSDIYAHVHVPLGHGCRRTSVTTARPRGTAETVQMPRPMSETVPARRGLAVFGERAELHA